MSDEELPAPVSLRPPDLDDLADPDDLDGFAARLDLARPRWHRRAACRGVDPDLFFPERGDFPTLAAARNVCAGCPVADLCMSYARDRPERFGVWGGTTEQDRKELRRQAS